MKRQIDDEMLKRLRAIFLKKIENAARNKIPFSLKFDDMYWPEFCPVLGIELNYLRKGSKIDASPSFDRVDNDLPYTPENTRIISWRANRLKSDGTEEEHRKIAAYINGSIYI